MGDIRMTDVVEDHADSDPIKASYDVYIKPGISGDRQIYVLQFPNRDTKQPYSQKNESKPFNLRIKPEAGMVEIDVPIDVWRNYDREKGIKWGDAVKKSSMTKGGGVMACQVDLGSEAHNQLEEDVEEEKWRRNPTRRDY
jgi:DNA-directed RNA polymerase III subunit RPC5